MSRNRKIGMVIYYTACIAFTLWMVLSFGEVVLHNLEPGYEYNRFNAFQIFVNVYKANRGV